MVRSARAVRAVLATLAVVASIVLPAYWVASGRAEGLYRFVPTEEVLRLAQSLGDASPPVIILLFVAVIAFLSLVWLAFSTACFVLTPVLGRSRRRTRQPSPKAG